MYVLLQKAQTVAGSTLTLCTAPVPPNIHGDSKDNETKNNNADNKHNGLKTVQNDSEIAKTGQNDQKMNRFRFDRFDEMFNPIGILSKGCGRPPRWWNALESKES